MISKIVNYIKSAIEEMKKVTWPTKKETRNYTFLVIGMCIGMAVFLGGLDFIFQKGLEILLALKQG